MRYLSTNEAGTSFFMRKFGADVGPTKQYRELTINAFEAHEAQMLGAPRERYEPVVEAYADPFYLQTLGVRKLAFGDNAVGMSGETLERHFAQLFVSGKVQATDKNYGIGSRVATARFNPAGVEVRSWQNGQGHMIRFELDPATDMYGLVDWDLGGGLITNVCPLDETAFEKDQLELLKPRFIDQHGTVVILLGAASNSDTTTKPSESDLTHKDYWFAHVVNRHLYTVSHEIKFTARVEAQHAGRVIHGYKWVLDRFALDSGTCELSDARVHWWLLDPDKGEERKMQRVTYHVFSGSKRHGHVAALWNNELFDFAEGYDGIQMLNRFGIVAGHDNVAIYVEPKSTMGVEANLNRTSLVVPGGLKLPWRRWGDEFARNMPSPLIEYVTKRLGHSDLDEELDKMIRQYGDDFRVPELVRAQLAPERAAERERGPIGRVGGGAGGGGGPSPEKRQERISAIRVPKADGEAARIRWLNRPRPKVFFRPDPRTGEEYDFRDRAAEYLDEQNMLYINRDFNVLQGLVDETAVKLDPTPSEELRAVCQQHVEAIYSMQIVYTVMTARATFRLRWDQQSYGQLVSSEALTACILPRIAMRAEIRRRVNSDPRIAALRGKVHEAVG